MAATREYTSRPPNGSTRDHRCTPEFLELLQEDFGIPYCDLRTPPSWASRAPKKEAIALCEWASRCDDPSSALLAWARKNGRGAFRPDDAAGDEE